MKSTELTIEIKYRSPYWVAVFEKQVNNRKSFACKRIGKTEPQQSDLSKFFASLNYKKLRYETL